MTNAADAAIAEGQAPDYDTLLKQREALIQETRDKLSEGLTAEGMAALHTFVLSEKRNMKMSAPASQAAPLSPQ